MLKSRLSVLFVLLFVFSGVIGQTVTDSIDDKKEFLNLEEALKSPEDVYRLNLSNQDIKVSDTIWSSFTNLQYLSLKNDHLEYIPFELGNLKNLKVLDLSGNDFAVLPTSFSKLTKLEELYLNDDKNLEMDKNIPILSTLPNLKTLHLENDGLEMLPMNMSQLNKLEYLYLNNNQFKQFPTQLKDLKRLEYLNLNENKFELPRQDILNENYGLKIKF